MKFTILIVFVLLALAYINIYAVENESANGGEFILQSDDSAFYNSQEEISVENNKKDQQNLNRTTGIGWYPLKDRDNIPFYLNVAVGLTVYVFFMTFTTGQLNVD